MVMSAVAMSVQNAPVRAQDFTLTLKVGAQTSPALGEMIADYNANHSDGYNVKIDEGTFETDSQFAGYVSRLSAGDDSFDVFALDVIWPPSMVQNNWLVDLTSDFPTSEQAKFLEAPIKAGTVDGHIYTVPWFHDSGLLYYRTDVLQFAADQGIISSAEPPKTQAELKDMAINLSTNQAIIDKFGQMDGFVWQGNAYEGLMCDFMEILGGTGQTSWLKQNSDGSYTADANTQNVKDALTYMNSLVKDGASPEAVLTYNEETSRAVWDSGDAIFHRNWPYAYKLSLNSAALNGSDDGSGELQYAVAPMPPKVAGDENARTSCLGGWQLAVNANSKHIQEAKDLIFWLTAEKQQLTHFAGNGNLPTRISAYDTAKLTAAGAGDQTYIVDFLPTFKVALPRPVHPDYPTMSEALWTPISQAISGDITPAAAATQMNDAIDGVLNPPKPTAAPINPIWVFFAVASMGIAVRFRRRED
jgi:multiple sugar transport system substrate-binding protein